MFESEKTNDKKAGKQQKSEGHESKDKVIPAQTSNEESEHDSQLNHAAYASDNGGNQGYSQNRQFLNSLMTNTAFDLNFIQEMARRLEFFKFLMKTCHC